MNREKQAKTKKIALIAVGLFILYYMVHHFTKSTGPVIPLPSVVVQKPKSMEMVEYVTQTGSTVAYNSIDLVARVEGYLDNIEFADGTFIKKGTQLFVIQPKPYLEQLKASQATVAAKKADYAYAQSEYARQKRMYRDNATSLNSVESWLAKMEESKADVDEAIANEEIAAINYSYTHINAPFDGRIGRHLVGVGNLVGNGVATKLATLEQTNKLYVYFNLNEIDLIKLRTALRAQGFKPQDIKTVPVYINMQNETGFSHKATLDFVNTGLNSSTGTMELRALLDNSTYLFVPGLFVQVQIAVSLPKKYLAVPSTALLYDQIGAYLLLVDKESKVLLQRVDLGPAEEGMQAVVGGLNADDQVIVNGLQNATPGNEVAIQGQKPAGS
jgi:RND family efflux transporter MFP subunit